MDNTKRYLLYLFFSIITGFAIAVMVKISNPGFLPQLNTFFLGILVFALPVDLILFIIQVVRMVRLDLPPLAFLRNDYYMEKIKVQKKSLEWGWDFIVQNLAYKFRISSVQKADWGYTISLKPSSNNLFGGKILFTFDSNEECQVAYRSGRIFDLGKDVLTVRKCREILETINK